MAFPLFPRKFLIQCNVTYGTIQHSTHLKMKQSAFKRALGAPKSPPIDSPRMLDHLKQNGAKMCNRDKWTPALVISDTAKGKILDAYLLEGKKSNWLNKNQIVLMNEFPLPELLGSPDFAFFAETPVLPQQTPEKLEPIS